MKKLSGMYVWLIDPDGERTLAYYYKNPDTQEWGYGFNTADGGGFIPEKDLSDRVVTVPTSINNPPLGFSKNPKRREKYAIFILQATLKDIASQGCERNTSGDCWSDSRTPLSPYSAKNICNPCLAKAALDIVSNLLKDD